MSHAARLIGMDRHVLALMCDDEQVTHRVRFTRTGQKRRMVPLSEVQRLQGDTVERQEKSTSRTTKATQAARQPSKSPDAGAH